MTVCRAWTNDLHGSFREPGPKTASGRIYPTRRYGCPRHPTPQFRLCCRLSHRFPIVRRLPRLYLCRLRRPRPSRQKRHLAPILPCRLTIQSGRFGFRPRKHLRFHFHHARQCHSLICHRPRSRRRSHLLTRWPGCRPKRGAENPGAVEAGAFGELAALVRATTNHPYSADPNDTRSSTSIVGPSTPNLHRCIDRRRRRLGLHIQSHG